MIKDYSNLFAKTKILATLGPATSSKEKIKSLFKQGLDGVRFNMSHGDHKFFSGLYKNIHDACVEEEVPVAILIDLQGPKIRIGELSKPEVEIETGGEIEITTRDVEGTKERISTSYKELPRDADIGDMILIDDGLVRLKVKEKKEVSVICDVIIGGTLKPRKGMNLPDMKISAPSVTEKDLNDLEFALENRADYVALSFVRTADDINNLREFIRQRGKDVPIIAKIEKKEAVKNFESILDAADGIMVARGDLGVEMETQEVPIAQKLIIRRCNAKGKLVITATQMLESMISNPIPTRAEASDIANAVWDGTDVVMLSGETSIGKYPEKTVEIMNNIIKNAEHNLPSERNIKYDEIAVFEENLFDSLNAGIVSISNRINARAIVVFTKGGRTAKSLAKYRPDARIIAISDSFDTMNNLCLRWGVRSHFCKDIEKEDPAIERAKKLVTESGDVEEGDVVIFTSGAPHSEKSRKNMLRFDVI